MLGTPRLSPLFQLFTLKISPGCIIKQLMILLISKWTWVSIRLSRKFSFLLGVGSSLKGSRRLLSCCFLVSLFLINNMLNLSTRLKLNPHLPPFTLLSSRSRATATSDISLTATRIRVIFLLGILSLKCVRFEY